MMMMMADGDNKWYS